MFNRLGDHGVRLSELGLGTNTFGSKFYNVGNVNEDLAKQMINTSLERGVNYFDTANIYSFGEAEEILGRVLRDIGVDRENVVVGSKVGVAMSEDSQEGIFHARNINRGGLSYKHIISACERSLERLGMDYIDLYQLHTWDPATPLRESLQAMTDLVRQGKVRYIGCSNWSIRHVMKALYLAEKEGLERLSFVQAYYSLLGRDVEYELLPLCREEGLGLLIWCPLAGGFLTGKYRREDEASEGGRRDEWDFPPVDEETGYRVVEEMDRLAQEKDVSIPQLALAWLLYRPEVTTLCFGVRTMDQLRDNLGASEVELTSEEHRRLARQNELRDLFPQWMIEWQREHLPPL